MKLSIYAFGLAVIFAGVVDIVWGGFDPGHQPLQAFGDHVPGAQIFAYVVASLLVIAGVAILRDRSRRFGANVVIAVYILFAIFWFPRFITAPKYLGYHAGVYIGVFGGVCEELIVVAGAMILAGWRSPAIALAFRNLPDRVRPCTAAGTRGDRGHGAELDTAERRVLGCIHRGCVRACGNCYPHPHLG